MTVGGGVFGPHPRRKARSRGSGAAAGPDPAVATSAFQAASRCCTSGRSLCSLSLSLPSTNAITRSAASGELLTHLHASQCSTTQPGV